MRRLARVTTAILLVSCVAAPAIGQQDPASARRGQPVYQPTSPVVQPHLITIDFKGGTLAELVDGLKVASLDRPVNIIYSEDAGGIPIPPFEVTDADLGATLISLAYTTRGSPVPLSFGRMAYWEVRSVGNDIFAVVLADARPQATTTDLASPATTQSDRYTAIYSITELITGESALLADDVLSALQAALAMEGGEEVKLAYHNNTGLVFARVSKRQGHVIESTISSLRVSHGIQLDQQKREPLARVLLQAGVTSTDALLTKVRAAEALRNQVLELQHNNAEQQDRIILLQDELASLKNILANLERRLKDGQN